MKNKYKINKKIFFTTLGTIILGITGFVFADDVKESIEAYLYLNEFDFMGKEFETMLFNALNEYPKNELHALWCDIKTMPIQLQCFDKILSENLFVYAPTTFFLLLKKVMPAKKFSSILFKIVKIILR